MSMFAQSDASHITDPVITQGGINIPCAIDTETWTHRGINPNPKFKADTTRHDLTSHVQRWELAYVDKSTPKRDDKTVYVITSLNGAFNKSDPHYKVVQNIQVIGVVQGDASATMKSGFPADVSVMPRGKARIFNNGNETINAGDIVMWDIPDPDLVAEQPNKKHVLMVRPWKPLDHRYSPSNFFRLLSDYNESVEQFTRDRDFPLIEGGRDVLQGFGSSVLASLHLLGSSGFLTQEALTSLIETVNAFKTNPNVATDRIEANRRAYLATLAGNPQGMIDVFNFLGEELGAKTKPSTTPYDEMGVDAYQRVSKKRKVERVKVPPLHGVGVAPNIRVSMIDLMKNIFSGVMEYLPFPTAKHDGGQINVEKQGVNNMIAQITDYIIGGIRKGENFYTSRWIGKALSSGGPKQPFDIDFTTV